MIGRDRFDFTNIPVEAINALDSRGNTALHYAAHNNHTDFMQLLIDKGADVNKRDKRGFTALDVAAFGRHPDAMRLLIEKGATCATSFPLVLACARNWRDMVPSLLEKTPFTAADLKPNSNFHRFLKYSDPDLQQMCLKKALQSYIDVRKAQPDTILGYSKNKKIKAAEALLDHMEGKSVDLTQHRGALNQGRLQHIYQQHNTAKEAIQQCKQAREASNPTEAEAKPDEGRKDQL